MKVAPARTRATRWGALTARQRSWAASMSLKAMARPAARDPGPLVTLLRCRTVAKVDLRVGRAQVHPVLGGIVVEREQLFSVIGDLRGGLRELRAVGGAECPDRGEGVLLVFGAPDLGQGLPRARVRGFRQRGENIRRFVKPAALFLAWGNTSRGALQNPCSHPARPSSGEVPPSCPPSPSPNSPKP